MPAVSIAIQPDPGIYLATQNNNGVIQLAPEPIFTPFVGDSTVWLTTGLAWTVSGDASSINSDGGDNYISVTYPIAQTVAETVTFRVTVSGQNIVAGGEYAMQMTLTDAGGLGGTILADQTVPFPSGSFSEAQFDISLTPPAPAHWLYAYIFARNTAGTLTVYRAEVFSTSGAIAPYGEWYSDAFDLALLASQPMITAGAPLVFWGFYYGDLSSVDDFYSVEHSIEILSRFPYLVCNEPGQNTTTRQQYVQQQLIAAGVKLYGYQNVGVQQLNYNNCMPPMSVIFATIDRCAAAGYAGVFLDGDGGGIPIEQNNAIADYAHAKGLALHMNSQPQYLNLSQSSATLPAPTGAPAATAAVTSGATLPAGIYNVGYTFTNYNGETTLSPLAQVTIASGDGISLGDVAVSYYTLGVNVYISDAPGSGTLALVESGYGFATTITAPATGPQPPQANTAYTGNYSGVPATFGGGIDWCTWESFYSRSDNKYAGVPEGGFANVMAPYMGALAVAQSVGLKICALAYQLNDIADDDYTDWINSWLLTVALGWQCLSYSTTLQGNAQPWSTPPTFPAVGTVTATATSAGANVWEAVTSEGVIHIAASDSPVERNFSAFATPASYNVSARSPTISAVRSTTQYEQSTDQSVWTNATFPVINARYLRLSATLRG